ncbi:MAG: type II toxin-antitoxin system YhaV family toxin [Syntrophobacteraceae bacterium]
MLSDLVEQVEAAKKRDPILYQNMFRTKQLAHIKDAICEVCKDPDHPKYRLGKSLGTVHTVWRRVKIGERYRLFFRFFSSQKEIFFVWINDESTLRKKGDREDVYKVFAAKLDQGDPPADRDSLLKESEAKEVPPPLSSPPKS